VLEKLNFSKNISEKLNFSKNIWFGEVELLRKYSEKLYGGRKREIGIVQIQWYY
jgi:hypothetical protein